MIVREVENMRIDIVFGLTHRMHEMVRERSISMSKYARLDEFRSYFLHITMTKTLV